MRSIFKKILRKSKAATRRSLAQPNPHPAGMDPQALEHPVREHRYDGSLLGVVKTNPDLEKRLLRELCRFVEEIFRDLGLNSDRNVEADVLDFFKLLAENPAREATRGATGDGLNLWLHLLVRQLQPEKIVESGVWVGRSLYTLRHALASAEVHAFDISFSKLMSEDSSIEYHEHDWSDSELKCHDIGFCYFDDHINNGRRIREAYDRGFRHLVFDQCAPVGMVHLFRYPGLPSAIMLGNDTLRQGDTLEWTWRDQNIRYRFEESHTHGAEDLIELVRPLPSLEAWIGENSGQAAYVRLKRKAT